MLRHLARAARRATDVPRYYGGGLVACAAHQPMFLWAQAIAFKVFVTLLPLILLATGIFGLVLRQSDPFETVASFLRTFLPEGYSASLVELVFALQAASGAVTVVGAVALLVAVVTLFSTLRYVIGAAMGETRHKMRTLLRGYLFDIRMVLQVGSLFLLSFAITFVAQSVAARSGLVAGALGLDPDVMGAVARGGVRLVGLVVPYLLTLAMLWQLYFFVPRPRPPRRSALLGAAVAAVLFEVAKNGFAVYARHFGGFDRFADPTQGALGGLGGVFGLMLAFVFWVYLSGLILVVGAVVTGLNERQVRPRQATLRRLWSRMDTMRRHRRRAQQARAAHAAALQKRTVAGPLPPPPDADPPGTTGPGTRLTPRAALLPRPVPERPQSA